MIKKIVVIGPESTGKSTLCEQLALHYKSVWVREYAREFLLTNGTGYSYEDLLIIAKGQVALEEKAIQEISPGIDKSGDRFGLLFIDTNMYVLKVWCEYVFGNCHTWILNQIIDRTYDLYLLCDIDLPWVKDELREYPNLLTREKLYHHYKDILVNQKVAWINISGNQDNRLQKAIEGIDKHLV